MIFLIIAQVVAGLGLLCLLTGQGAPLLLTLLACLHPGLQTLRALQQVTTGQLVLW